MQEALPGVGIRELASKLKVMIRRIMAAMPPLCSQVARTVTPAIVSTSETQKTERVQPEKVRSM